MDPVRGIDNPALENPDREEKSRAGSQVRQSSRERDKRALDQGGRSDRYSDHYSDSDSDYNERRRRSHERSRDRDYKKNQHDDEKGGDRAYRRRRSYGSDDSDYEYDRERKRRSREKISRDRYDDYSDSDKERYRREGGRYVDKSQDHRDNGDGDMNSSLDNSLHEDDRDRASQRKKRDGERRLSSADRDKYSSPRRGSKQMRRQDDLHSLEAYRASPSLDLPPPYSEEDTSSLSYKLPPPEEDLRHADHEYTNLPQTNKYTEPDVKQPHNVADDSNYRRSSGDRRDRYSQNRWTPKQGSHSSPAAQYGDITSTSAPVIYKEESV